MITVCSTLLTDASKKLLTPGTRRVLLTKASVAPNSVSNAPFAQNVRTSLSFPSRDGQARGRGGARQHRQMQIDVPLLQAATSSAKNTAVFR
jgi:hypothetical protein